MRVFLTATTALLAALLASPAQAARDTQPPLAGFSTADGSVVIGTPAPPPAETGLTSVRGWAKDASGVRSVTLTYCPGSRDGSGGWRCGGTGSVGALTSQVASLTCAKGRRSCTWTAPPPLHPGAYLAFVRATDSSNRHRHVGPIQLYVA